jgi:hypothetical protein
MSNQQPFFGKVLDGQEVPRILGRGRPKGSGINMIALSNLKKGGCLWNVTKDKMFSFKFSASIMEPRVRLKIRKLPNGYYAIFKL